MGRASIRTRAVAVAISAVGITALLAGCAGSSPSAGAAVDSAEGTAEEAAEEAGGGDLPDPGGPGTGAECLIGSWELRNGTFEAALAEMLQNDPAVPSEMRAGMRVSIEGKSSLRFGDDGDYGAWQDEYSMIIEALGERMQHVQSSADIARYKADGERVWVSEFHQLFVEAEMRLGDFTTVKVPNGNASMASISFFGHTADVPIDERELLDGSASYLCEGDTLSLHADGFPSAAEFTRVADITRS